MTDKNPADSNPTDKIPADQNPVDPTTASDTAGPTAPMPATAAAAAPAAAPTVVEVQRRFLIAGSAVGALAVVGLSFGAGYLVGHDGHDDRGRHSRSQDVMIDEQRQQQQQMEQFPGFGGLPGRGQLPGMGQSPDRDQQQEAPATTTPSSIPG